MINKVTAKSFKGSDFSHDLTKVNLISGRNFKGKTSIIDAIKVGLLGFHPDLGKRNPDTFRLSSGLSMSVALEMEGHSVVRQFEAARGSVKASTIGSVPEGMEKTISIMLNPAEYFELSENQRINYVFSMIDGGEAADFRKKLKKLIRSEAEEGDEVAEELCDEISDIFKASKNDICVFIDSIVKQFGDRLRAVKRDIKKMQETIKGLSALGDEVDALATSLESIDENIEKVNEKYTAKLKEQNTIEGALKRSEQQQSRQNRLKKILDEITETDTSELVKTMRDMEAQRDEIKEKMDEMSGKDGQLYQLRASVSELKGKLKAAHTVFKTEKGDIDEFDAHDACPYCEASEEGWKDRVLGRLNKQLAKTEKNLKKIDKQLGAEKAKLDDEEDLYRELDKQGSALNTDIQDLRQRITGLENANVRYRAAKEELDNLNVEAVDDSKLDEIIQEVFDLKAEVEELRAQRDKAIEAQGEKRKIAEAEEELEGYNSEKEITEKAIQIAKDKKAEIVSNAFDKILEPANKLTHGILQSDLQYNDGEIGYWEKGQWVSFKTFSGTEQALAYAAVGLGVATLSPFKLVVIDELGRLDGENLNTLFQRALDCVEEGLIDQFIGISTDFTEWVEAHTGVNTITVS